MPIVVQVHKFFSSSFLNKYENLKVSWFLVNIVLFLKKTFEVLKFWINFEKFFEFLKFYNSTYIKVWMFFNVVNRFLSS